MQYIIHCLGVGSDRSHIMEIQQSLWQFHQLWFVELQHTRAKWFAVLVVLRFLVREWASSCLPSYFELVITLLIGWQIVFDCTLCTIDCIVWIILIRKVMPPGEPLWRLSNRRFCMVAVLTLCLVGASLPKLFYSRELWTAKHGFIIQMLHFAPYFAVRIQTICTGFLVAALEGHPPKKEDIRVETHTLSNYVLILYSFWLCITTFISLGNCVGCVLTVGVCVTIETVARSFLVDWLNVENPSAPNENKETVEERVNETKEAVQETDFEESWTYVHFQFVYPYIVDEPWQEKKLLRNWIQHFVYLQEEKFVIGQIQLEKQY